MHPERAAFEKAIDENPHEATTHLAYADWLDENGDHDEAAFRRAMGKWVQRGPYTSDRFKPPTDELKSFESGEPSDDTFNQGWGGFTHSIYHRNLPTWAESIQRASGNNHRRVIEDPAIAFHPNVYWLHWRGYRNMEEGLRRAFMEDRRRNPEQYAKAYAEAAAKSSRPQ